MSLPTVRALTTGLLPPKYKEREGFERMSLQTPVKGGRIPAPSIPGNKKMSPPPDKPSGSRRWLLWAIAIPLLLLGLTYLLGRLVEPVRARLEPLPVVGNLLFKDPVWQVLWNKPAAAPDEGKTPVSSTDKNTPGTTTPSADVSALEAQAAARLAAAEVKENELKQKEADLAAREKALKTREQSVMAQEKTLGAEIKAAEDLRKLLEGQRRTELDRVEVVRNMKSSAQQQLFAALTDEELLRILMYMDATEVAKHLSTMDPYRSARLLQALREVAPPTDQ